MYAVLEGKFILKSAQKWVKEREGMLFGFAAFLCALGALASWPLGGETLENSFTAEARKVGEVGVETSKYDLSHS